MQLELINDHDVVLHLEFNEPTMTVTDEIYIDLTNQTWLNIDSKEQ